MISTILELVGFGCLVAAAALLSPILGLALAGLVLVLIGYLAGGS